jgi:hypothetical protein
MVIQYILNGKLRTVKSSEVENQTRLICAAWPPDVAIYFASPARHASPA